MKSKYQKWLWPIIILDVALIIVVVVTGPAAFHKARGRAVALIPTPMPAPTQVPQPLHVEVLLPENVIEQRDYPLTLKITNQSENTIQVKNVLLPAAFMSNNELITSEPVLNEMEESSAGLAYTLNFELKPSEEKSIIFILRAEKMQALTDSIVLGTNIGDQQVPLLVAVAPDTQSQPYVNEAFPFKSLVKVSAMYRDANGQLQVGWSGIGTILTSDGMILTNAHTVLPNRSLNVDAVMVSIVKERDAPPEDMFLADVLQADYYLDLAVIQIKTDLHEKLVNKATLQLPAVEIGQPETMSLGKRLSFLGLQGSTRKVVTQVNGDISSIQAQEPYGDRAFVSTSAALPSSFSGGMVLNEQGKMVGVSVMYVSPKGALAEGTCRYEADTNNDRVINSRDLCMPSNGVVTGLRPIDLAQKMIDDAKAGVIEIHGFPRDQIIMLKGNKVVLQDNFMDMKSGWVNAVTDDRVGAYNNGVYQISLNTIGDYGIGFYQNKKFTDNVTRVKVHEVTQADDAFFGLVCRYTNIENYYLLAVSTDGRYSIQKVENDIFSVLVPWTYSPAIPIHQDMELTGVCDQDTLTLGVNGIPLAQVRNDAHWRGMTGLAAGTFGSDHFAVAFDDIQIQTP
jgi:S1-C subfamily serine protease